ncbi:MAG: glycosyltransferase [Bacteroidetes bacterium]|nr:glycosyltransferase [Bacteroidota bacterium]
MRILQLCIRVPFPPVDGGSIAMYHLQKSLYENGVQLKVLSFNTIKQLTDLNTLDDAYKKMTKIEGIYLDNRINPFAALFNIFTGESYHIIRFIRRDFEEALIRILKKEKFDTIILESLYMIPYMEVIREFSNAKVVLRTHNIEHLIWKRLAQTEKLWLRKWYLNLLAERLRHYEQWSLNRVDGIAAMTKEDQDLLIKLGADVPIHIAPVGVNTQDYPFYENPDPLLVFHIGAMDWLPNIEGIEWFLKEVWPIIQEKKPAAKLTLAGKKMPDSIKTYANKQIEVNDFVKDNISFIGKGGIMIVPLFSGSGMRVKIVEGMAMGKAIVTTSIGAEGIHGVDGRDFLIANTAAEFAGKVLSLLDNPSKQKELGTHAKDFATSHFDNLSIGKKLIDFFHSIDKR